jgi:D-beta-D-heptose 7-phosphate kinase/D-beta-D-heptose 1-phosphate adenosyltransferase
MRVPELSNQASIPTPPRWSRSHLRKDSLPWARVDDLCDMDLPRPLVFVNGCFDLLHSSHFRLLYAAARQAKTLVVAMDSDERVRALKGAGRPILSWVERATALSWTPASLLVEFGSDEDLAQIISALRPDLRVTGSDKILNPGYFPACPGLRTLFVPVLRDNDIPGLSTTEIIRRCKKA